MPARQPDRPTRANRYPDLRVWFELPEINRKYTAKYLQAIVLFSTYKGTVQLEVLRDDQCKACSGAHLAGSAWLRGDDLDALIAILRDYKRLWLREYRKAERTDRKWDYGRKRNKAGSR